MRPGVVMEENHIVHENPRSLFPDGSSQTCECATIEVPPSTHTTLIELTATRAEKAELPLRLEKAFPITM
jgi:hypothetical protein